MRVLLLQLLLPGTICLRVPLISRCLMLLLRQMLLLHSCWGLMWWSHLMMCCSRCVSGYVQSRGVSDCRRRVELHCLHCLYCAICTALSGLYWCIIVCTVLPGAIPSVLYCAGALLLSVWYCAGAPQEVYFSGGNSERLSSLRHKKRYQVPQSPLLQVGFMGRWVQGIGGFGVGLGVFGV